MNTSGNPDKVRLIASIPNFEGAYFGQNIRSGKPYNALVQLQNNSVIFMILEKILDCLLYANLESPTGSIAWTDESQLLTLVNSFAETAPFFEEEELIE